MKQGACRRVKAFGPQPQLELERTGERREAGGDNGGVAESVSRRAFSYILRDREYGQRLQMVEQLGQLGDLTLFVGHGMIRWVVSRKADRS